MLHAACNANLIKGFRPSRGAEEISHLQFPVDTLLFCDANETQICNIKAILMCFEAVSGLRVNFFQSEMIGVRVDEDRLAILADLFGCRAGSLPSSYLGLPLCHSSASKSMSQPVLERIERKLTLWKANYLSLGGRITLIIAALANLPIYVLERIERKLSLWKANYLSLGGRITLIKVALANLPIYYMFIDQIERLQWNFLWNGKEKNKFHLVK